MSYKRKKLLIDRPVQTQIVARVVLHWFTFLAAAVLLMPVMRIVLTGDISTPITEQARQAWQDGLILLLVFVALLPYFVYDSFKTTNRFAGPMYRLHQSIKAIGEGLPLPPVKFRKDDFWQEVATDFNKMVDHLREEQPAPARPVADAETADAANAVEV